MSVPKERPILMNGEMVRAILDGEKTQTRRIVKPQPGDDAIITVGEIGTSRGAAYVSYPNEGGICSRLPCPYGQPGDRLWVREAWAYHVQAIGSVCDEDGPFVYAADAFSKQNRLCEKWTPSIHMPRWASRILLEITGVRVERLQDISELDALAEGCAGFDDDVTGGKSGYSEYAELWNSINGPGSWDANPWVWVIEFKVVQA